MNKLYHVEIGVGAKGLVSALRRNFKIKTIKFNRPYCLMGYSRKSGGEASPTKIFVCGGCGFAQTEKPGTTCDNCGADVSKLKGKNLNTFLENNVYSGE